jgi:hypothetical protein
MIRKVSLFLGVINFLISFSFTASAQSESTYELNFLRAKIIDTTDLKDILILFQVTTKKKKDFPPILSMKLTYSLDNNAEKTVDILKTNNIQISVFGNDVNEKDKFVYELIKNKIDIDDKNDFLILAFLLKSVTNESVDKMSFTYGLWEKNNQKVRVEKKYEFEIDQ